MHGYKDLKHISRDVKAHNKAANHLHDLTACLKLEMFGKIDIAGQLATNLTLTDCLFVGITKKLTGIGTFYQGLIDCIKFCGEFELALRGHDESPDSNNSEIIIQRTHRFCREVGLNTC